MCERVLSCAGTGAARDGATVSTAGIVLVRQRPGKGNAIFISIEDETGVTNIVLWARQFELFRREIMGARLMLVRGKVQRSPEGVVHLMAASVVDRSEELRRLWAEEEPQKVMPAARRIEPPPSGHRHPRDVRVLPKSRDFH